MTVPLTIYDFKKNLYVRFEFMYDKNIHIWIFQSIYSMIVPWPFMNSEKHQICTIRIHIWQKTPNMYVEYQNRYVSYMKKKLFTWIKYVLFFMALGKLFHTWTFKSHIWILSLLYDAYYYLCVFNPKNWLSKQTQCIPYGTFQSAWTSLEFSRMPVTSALKNPIVILVR